MTHFFSNVPKAPSDPIFGLTASFLKDPREEKVNLSVGIYKTEQGKTPVLSCVKEAEKFFLEQEETKSYLPIEGDPLYLKEIAALIFGRKLYGELSSHMTLVQSLGGAGALRLGGEFIAQELKESSCYIPDPTWPNHEAIFTQSRLSVKKYPYYDFKQKKVDFDAMVQHLSSLPPKSLIVLHASCHNPSGADLSRDQWSELADLCLSKGLIPFFDAAYLGFDVSFEEDAYPLQLFAHKGVEFLASISFSKNFSLYAERIGAFVLFSKGSDSEAILSQLKRLVRRNYSNPPLHGAKLIGKILQTPSLKLKWEEELAEMRKRISSSKSLLVSSLANARTQTDYSYLLDKKGLFSFCNLSKLQVERLAKEFGIYMTSDGRINIVGLNNSNIDYVVKSLVAVGG